MKILFIYNANSDRLNRWIDAAHKIVSPTTYQCDLCSLTHGNFGEKEEWKQFLQSTKIDIEFYHIDDFETKFKLQFNYPVILKEDMSIAMDKEEIHQINSTEELIQHIQSLLPL